MTRNEWIKQNFTHVTFTEAVGNLRVPKINVELTYGLLSTENYDEFQKLVFHLMPPGTIVDDIDPEFYEGKIVEEHAHAHAHGGSQCKDGSEVSRYSRETR